tara:strand:- start:569 stop:1651 length:1083 start_codon:yes stop_codon:yes gene_type:complete
MNKNLKNFFSLLKRYFNQFLKSIHLNNKESLSDTPPPIPGNSVTTIESILIAPFSPSSKEVIHQITLLSCFVAGPYFFGKTLANIIFPTASTQKLSPIDFNSGLVKSRKPNTIPNVLGLRPSAEKEKTEPVKKVVNTKKSYAPCQNALKKTRLSVKVESLTILKNSKKSIGEFKIGGKKNIHYLRSGDKVAKIGVLGLLTTDKAFIRNLSNGECEYIALKKNSKRSKKLKDFKVHSPDKKDKFISNNPRIVNQGNSFKIKESLREEMLGNISSILTQARAIPITNGDGTLSFKITEIVPGSIYSQLNIKENDIITGINGKSVSSINEVTSLLGKVRDLRSLSITVERDGEEKVQDYSFEQ